MNYTKNVFFYNYLANERKTNVQIILPDKRHYVITKTYNTTEWIKKDYATLNKHNPLIRCSFVHPLSKDTYPRTNTELKMIITINRINM